MRGGGGGMGGGRLSGLLLGLALGSGEDSPGFGMACSLTPPSHSAWETNQYLPVHRTPGPDTSHLFLHLCLVVVAWSYEGALKRDLQGVF